jgi:hypothetical protein
MMNYENVLVRRRNVIRRGQRTSINIRPLTSQSKRGTRTGIVCRALASHKTKDIQTPIQVVELYVVRT